MLHKHPKELMFLKQSSGIGRGHGKRKKKSSGSEFFDKSSYESGVEYKTTREYDYEYKLDPKGKYFNPETHERYTLEEYYAENAGFREIRRASVGTVIEVVLPETEGLERMGGRIPEHKEYWRVTQDTKTQKGIEFIGTTGNPEYFMGDFGRQYVDIHRRGTPIYNGRLGTVKDIQRRYKYIKSLTIYKPKS